MLNDDYKEMLQCLSEEDLEFLLVVLTLSPMDQISESDFSTEGVIFQIGNSPRRIDIGTTIEGIKFDQAYANRKVFRIEGLQVPVISLEDLIANKRASGRKQDLADVEKLESQLQGKRK
jgi:hypothetical protein